MKSVFLIGIVVNEKTRKREDGYNCFEIKNFIGVDILKLKIINVSVDKVNDVAINAFPVKESPVSYVAYLNEDDCSAEKIQCWNSERTRLYGEYETNGYCQVYNSKGEEWFRTKGEGWFRAECRGEEWVHFGAKGIGVDIFYPVKFIINLNPISVDIVPNDYGYANAMLSSYIDTSFFDFVKSKYLKVLDDGMYEYRGDTIIVTEEYVSKSVVLPKHTKTFIFVSDGCSIIDIVFNKKIDRVIATHRRKIRRVAMSKEISYKQFAEITKFVADCNNKDYEFFNIPYRDKDYKKCFEVVMERRTLAVDIYECVEVVVY